MKGGPFDASQPIDPREPGSASRRDDAGGPIPDHLIDQVLDGNLAGEKVRRALDALRRDQAISNDLAWTADALRALRADAGAPDMSDIILARTGMKRSWLSGVMRRKMFIGRVVGVAAVLALIGGAFVMQRMSPATFRTEASTPLVGLVEALPSDAARAAIAVRGGRGGEGVQALEVAIFAIDDDDAYYLEDDASLAWQRGLTTLASWREWLTPRDPGGRAEDDGRARILDAGFSPGVIGGTGGSSASMTIMPVLTNTDRESAAAIRPDRR